MPPFVRKDSGDNNNYKRKNGRYYSSNNIVDEITAGISSQSKR